MCRVAGRLGALPALCEAMVDSAAFIGMHHPATPLIFKGLGLSYPLCRVAGRLGALPVLCEAMVDSAVFIGVYGMPPALGFTGGFILSALSPTVLVTGAPLRARPAIPSAEEPKPLCPLTPCLSVSQATAVFLAYVCGAVVPRGALSGRPGCRG